MPKHYYIEDIQAHGREIRPVLEQFAKILATTPQHVSIIALLSMAALMENPALEMEELPEIVYSLSTYLCTLVTGGATDDDDPIMH